MTFYFSKKITVIGLIAAALMLRASYWQWERYHWKLDLISRLEANFSKEPVGIEQVTQSFNEDPSDYIHRRVLVKGTYDFSKEMVLRNRRVKDEPGVFVLTPLKPDNGDEYVLVNRGFVPLSKASPDTRKAFQRDPHVELVGLVKESATKKFLAPSDKPTGQDKPWVDSWLRIDLKEMSQQLPYTIAPFYLEIVNVDGQTGIEIGEGESVGDQFLDTRAGKEEMFFLPGKGHITATTKFSDDELPVPVFDKVIPPGRHYGYIYEWAIMAFATLLITVGLQLRRPISHHKNTP